MIRKLLTALWLSLGLLSASAAQATTDCPQPNFGEFFNQLSNAPGTQYIAYGFLRASGRTAISSEGNMLHQDAGYEFQGYYLGSAGFDQPARDAVSVTSWSHGPVKSPLRPVYGPMLTYLDSTPDGNLRWIAHDCSRGRLDNPSERQLQSIAFCMQRGRCNRAELDVFAE